ncbi:cytoplasmic protein [Lyophyllum atratum]|nr:cytoplasmic protein [Lyophyllum atratum]
MFSQIFKAIINLFCGPSDAKPPQQVPQHHQQYPQQQYPQQQYPQQPYHPKPTYPHKPQQQGYKPTSQSHPQQYEDLNQLNQSNEHYTGLRARANEEGDSMAKCFEQSHQAYSRGDGAEAKALSNRGKEHQRKMQDSEQASGRLDFHWYISKDSKPGEIDLHGLYVKEAILRTDQAIQDAKQRGVSEIHLIARACTPKVVHAKIKPAIEELMQKHQLRAELDPQNAGVLIVQINSGGDRGRKDEGCTIM